MTYSDIDTSHNRDSVNCHEIQVECHGEITIHHIHGQTREIAIGNLMRTGWYINSARNVIL